MKQKARVSSAYAAHASLVGLSRVPLRPQESLRPAWSEIFSDKSCYKAMSSNVFSKEGVLWDGDLKRLVASRLRSPDRPNKREIERSIPSRADVPPKRIISDDWPYWSQVTLPSKPFIRKLGPIGLSPGRFLLDGRYDWNIKLPLGLRDPLLDDAPFGLATSGDHRMSFIPFELARPTRIACVSAKKLGCLVESNVFLHIYPCGAIVLILATQFNWEGLRSVEAAQAMIAKTKPWRKRIQWVWSTPFGPLTLQEFFLELLRLIDKSLFTTPTLSLNVPPGTTAQKFVFPSSEEITSREVLHLFQPLHPLEILEIRHSRHTVCSLIGKAGQTTIHGGKAGEDLCHEIYRARYRRDAALGQFWRLFFIQELVVFKLHVYDRYRDYLTERLDLLRSYRLNKLSKLLEEDVLQISAYDHSIVEFIRSLDAAIRGASPFYRKAYSMISSAFGFDDRRKRLNSLTESWIEEIERWEHPLVVAWKLLLSPIRRLFGQ